MSSNGHRNPPTADEIERGFRAPAVVITRPLILGGIGIYGVISQAVAQRTNEIGIRRALGAGGGQVTGMILRQGALMALLGIGLGLVSALVLNRVLVSFLYEVSTTDPATYVLVAGAVAVVAALAAFVPARRASRVDPMEALRTE